jgi:hypothetical protein
LGVELGVAAADRGLGGLHERRLEPGPRAGRESLAGAFVEAGAEAAPRADVAERRRVIQFFKERTGA